MLQIIDIMTKRYFFNLVCRRWVILKVVSSFEVTFYDVRPARRMLEVVNIRKFTSIFNQGEFIKGPVSRIHCVNIGDFLSSDDNILQSLIREITIKRSA